MGGFGGQSGLQVVLDGAVEVSLPLLDLPGFVLLAGLQQPLVLAGSQAVQLRVALRATETVKLLDMNRLLAAAAV